MVETAINYKVKTTIEVYSQKDLQFYAETTEQNLKKEFSVTFLDFLMKRRLKSAEARKSKCKRRKNRRGM